MRTGHSAPQPQFVTPKVQGAQTVKATRVQVSARKTWLSKESLYMSIEKWTREQSFRNKIFELTWELCVSSKQQYKKFSSSISENRKAQSTNKFHSYNIDLYQSKCRPATHPDLIGISRFFSTNLGVSRFPDSTCENLEFLFRFEIGKTKGGLTLLHGQCLQTHKVWAENKC